MFELLVETDFAAAHFLREYEGKCEAMHGHNWRVEVRLRSEELDPLGMAMDFGDVKRHIGETIDAVDHHCLNELAPFEAQNPTTENIARYIYRELGRSLPPRVQVSRVTVWETDHCGAAYFEE